MITLKKILLFPLTRIILGALAIVATVVIGEVLREFVLPVTGMSAALRDVIVGSIQIILAVLIYILLFQSYEKREIKELNIGGFWKNSLTGFIAGIGLQALFILIIYIAAHYSIVSINPVSFLLPGFISALVAGVVMEILLRGILFRITEQYLGTTIATIIISLLFVIMHSRADNATILSVTATTIQAGILLSSVYVFSRSLWFPIFLHFAWDFAEPAIFGGINPGISVGETLFTSNITGPELLTGGQNGPGNSIQAAGFCLFVSILFLLLAKKKGNIIKPFWK